MENTKIEWTAIQRADGTIVPGSTFNPWEGCAKVSPGCRNCYAEGQHKHRLSSLATGLGGPGTCWGVGAPRMGRSESYWKQPLKWNAEAQRLGERRRVFCASMADVFEQQSELSASFAGQTAPVPTGNGKHRLVEFVNLDEQRIRLFALIQQTPHLDWLLLTKRPEAIMLTLTRLFRALGELERNSPTDKLAFNLLEPWVLDGRPPANVWLGTSVEDQPAADERVPALLAVPARVHFLSCEPLLGPVNVSTWLAGYLPIRQGVDRTQTTKRVRVLDGVDWVIVGGESGRSARPMQPAWALSLLAQCQAAGTAFLFKQWGEWGPEPEQSDEQLQGPAPKMWKVGKKHTGRVLAGRTWDGVPDQAEQ